MQDNRGHVYIDGTRCDSSKIYFGKILFSPSLGYVKVVTIPQGARNIHVEELRASENTIAVGPAAGNTYYLNGDL